MMDPDLRTLAAELYEQIVISTAVDRYLWFALIIIFIKYERTKAPFESRATRARLEGFGLLSSVTSI